jgi:hypothetical protein
VVAEAIVREAAALRCNCRAVVARSGVYRAPGGPGEGDFTVRGGQWDCPSCGLDKRHALAEMVSTAGAAWLLTLTMRQPRAFDVAGAEVTPEDHERCSRRTHVYEYRDRHGKTSWRWRTLATCEHCVKRISLWRKHFVQRVRRVWGEFGYLDVIEDHKNGAYHLHFAVVGIPRDVERKRAGHLLGLHWYALGGGRVDLAAPPGREHAGALGWYLGKYLAKRQEQRMAKGHRRWGRSRNFAPEVLMAWSEKWRQRFQDQRSATARTVTLVEPKQSEPRQIVGWWHPILPVVARRRVWVSSTDPP